MIRSLAHVPEDALVTLLAVESADQQHFLLPAWGLPAMFGSWLIRWSREIDPGSAARALRQTIELIHRTGGHPLPDHYACRCSYRYLISFRAERLRILVSAWSRQDPGSPWQRLWTPRQLKPDGCCPSPHAG